MPGVMVEVDTVGGAVTVAQGVSGTSHLPAESVHSSNCPFGPRQSLATELSHVPRRGEGEKGSFKGYLIWPT